MDSLTPRQITELILKEREQIESNDPAQIGTIRWIHRLCDLMEGVNVRDIIVCDLIIQMGPSAELYPTRCKTCGAWKIHKTDAGWFGCWLCYTDDKHAREGRLLLLRVQRAAEPALSLVEPEERTYWPHGMAL